MSVRRRRRADRDVAQPDLPLGHAEVRWDALPPAVQADVLARWCEMLSTALASPARLHSDLAPGEAQS